ncbi:hypothetical protein CSW58_09995 [Caulobacter sp. B11]|uniref:hypothetical protein n=1 Tax=Caulobacter sp. B11 TaxID=2048899 RepID=UPI000C12CC8F|nr:hypothetical protein [Caulobacter sp. B11]PHY12823.1 hypothetical protein CSW58_09995 [Caulobacter sp. B11]
MAANPLADLGLELDSGPRDVPLNEGVVLTMRPPESRDWSIVRARVARLVEAQDTLRQATRLYGWSPADLKDLIEDQESWETAAAHMIYSELAVRVVSAVRSATASVEPSREVFCQLFRRDGNLALFSQAANAAGEGLVRAKKE